MIKAFSSLRILVLLVIVALVVSCGGTQPATTTATTPLTTTTTTTPPAMTTTTPPTTTTIPTTTTPIITTTTPATSVTTTTATLTMTWGELANRGRGSFLGNCAPCHGDDGKGSSAPQNIGPNLRSYGTAQILLDYISTQMPQDGPGSLSDSHYLRILVFILTESGFVLPEAIFDADNLSNVILN